MSLEPRLAEAAKRAAAQHETPIFLTDAVALERGAEAIERAFPDPWLRSYSLKADPHPALVRRLAARGWGANCVSLGEMEAARAAGVAPGATTLEGIGKGGAELDAAIAASRSGRPLRWIAIESLDEARDLARRATVALDAQHPLRVLLRLNPGVEPGTHAGLAVGRSSSKFGMDGTELAAAAGALGNVAGLRIVGIHLHAGSQLRDRVAWRASIDAALDAYAALAGAGRLDADALQRDGTICVGGGLPVDYALDRTDASIDRTAATTTAESFAATCDDAWRSHASLHPNATPPLRAIEPGRALVASATLLLARVLHVRARRETVRGRLAGPHAAANGEASCARQVILDGGMTELPRPALYDAWHRAIAVARAAGDREELAALHGPICESTDALGAQLLPTTIARGDLVAILDAGAYADAMRSTYNGRPAPARLTVERDGALTIDRQRGASI